MASIYPPAGPLLVICFALLANPAHLVSPAQAQQPDPNGAGEAEGKTSVGGRELIIEAERRLAVQLQKPASLQFLDLPLEAVFRQIAQQTGANTYVDQPALEDWGIGKDTPVTLAVRGLSYRSCLNLLCEQLTLAWWVDDGVLIFSTPEVAESRLLTRVYPIADLLHPGDKQARKLWLQTLLEAITATVSPDSWDLRGGPSSIDTYDTMLVVSQTRSAHDQLAGLLTACRRLAGHERQNNSFDDSPLALHAEQLAKIRQRLARPADVKFLDVPLQQAVERLAAEHQIPIVIDQDALEDFGIGRDVPLTFALSGLPLSRTLRLMLQDLELTYLLRDEVLIVTTSEEAEADLLLRVYPVGDLVGADGDGERLIAVLNGAVAPSSWDQLGGPGAIEFIHHPRALIVAQSGEVHARLEELLFRLRQARQRDRGSRAVPGGLGSTPHEP